MTAFLFALARWLRARDAQTISGRGGWTVSRLGFRGASFRPARSVLSAALVAAAAFIIVSVDAFRRDGGELTRDTQSGTGGYVLLAQSEVPIVPNPDTKAGRDALLVQSPELERASFTRFRLRPGNDVSCLNLYRPSSPTIIAPKPRSWTTAVLRSRRRSRRQSKSARIHGCCCTASSTTGQSRRWLTRPRCSTCACLRWRHHGDGRWRRRTRHASFRGGAPRQRPPGRAGHRRGQIRAAVPDSGGFRFFLIDSDQVETEAQAAALAGVVEKELQPFGVDAVSTTERLAAFHRVENTYLSTFQALGGLGLLLGTIGLAAVMFRNVLERRRELALLRAVGYDRRHVRLMILAETIFLLLAGLVAGVVCALIAVIPAWLSHGGGGPGPGLILLVAAIAVAGVIPAAAATRAAVSGRLLDALRAE